ncbi:MAG: GNAT family N-acetyltransferase, partial [Isosphaeraceae bacterium]
MYITLGSGLEEIHIAPPFQGRGIGQMLIRKVLAEA